MKITPSRRVAFQILQRVEQERAYASVLLASVDPRLREDDRALCHELVLGVLRNQLWLDRTIQHFAQRKIERIDLPVKLALRLALYQLRFLSRIPPSAAVNESVNLVRAARHQSAAGFVNAVLRKATGEPDYDPTLSEADGVEKLMVETSHPRWLLERWIDELGFEDAAALARANNKPPPLAFRFTAKSVSMAYTLLDELKDSGANLSPSKITHDAWRMSRVNEVVRRYLLDGLIYFQDEASQLVAQSLGVGSADRVLDVCAAPGSKATQISMLAPEAKIVAGDLYEHRLRTMKELAERQRALNVYPAAYDASGSLPFVDRSFDRVLVDAPCSGTGTLRHNPEIRWRLETSDISELANKQQRILAKAASAVKVGGRLVYSTCSVEPEENEEVVRGFLKDRTDFAVVPFENLAELRTNTGAIRTWPHRHDADGFFIAVLVRRC